MSRINSQIQNRFQRQTLGASLFLVLAVGLIGCGDSSQATDSKFLSANSAGAITGTWTLISVNDNAVSESDTATIAVDSSGSLCESQSNCAGAINARFISETELGFDRDSDAGRFVDFPASVEANRARIIEALKAGAIFKLNDSILTLQNSTGTLVFIPAK